jgi:hypothetical protein
MKATADPFDGMPIEEEEILGNFTSEPEGKSEPWAEIAALPSLLPVAPSLPPEMLPRGLAGWLTDVSDRMQIPLETPAAAAIVALSSIIGRNVAIHPKRHDDWLVYANLFGAVVGRSGSMKSAGIAEALKPIGSLIAKSQSGFAAEMKSYRAAADVTKAKIEAIRDEMKKAARKKDEARLSELQRELENLQSKDESDKPLERRHKINDATVEKILELLRDNPRGLLLSRDELGGWLRNLDRSGREGDREFFLEAWNGDGSFTTDRIGRGTTHADGLCLSIVGGIQPAKLSAYIEEALNGGIGDDGLIQRFQLLVYPEIGGTWQNVDRYPIRESRDTAYHIFEALDGLNPEAAGIPHSDFSDAYALRFDSDGQDFFDAWRCTHENRLRSGEISTPAFESHLAKYASLMPSLALIFHLTEWAADSVPTIPMPAVGLRSARLAADWCDFLELHAIKVYAGAIHPDIQAAHVLADKIREGKVRDMMPMRDIYRAQWSGLKTKSLLYEAATILQDCGMVRVESQETERKPSDVIRINPSLGGPQ